MTSLETEKAGSGLLSQDISGLLNWGAKKKPLSHGKSGNQRRCALATQKIYFSPSDTFLAPQCFQQTSISRDIVERNRDDHIDREQLHSSKPGDFPSAAAWLTMNTANMTAMISARLKTRSMAVLR